MRWRWKRQRTGRHWALPNRVPDNEVSLHPDGRRWADIGRAVLDEPTRAMPAYRPLMTPGQQWRSRGGRR